MLGWASSFHSRGECQLRSMPEFSSIKPASLIDWWSWSDKLASNTSAGVSSNPYLRCSQLPWPMSSRGIGRVFTHPQTPAGQQAQVQDSGSLFLPMGLWLVAKTRWGASQDGHKAHLPNTADAGMA